MVKLVTPSVSVDSKNGEGRRRAEGAMPNSCPVLIPSIPCPYRFTRSLKRCCDRIETRHDESVGLNIHRHRLRRELHDDEILVAIDVSHWPWIPTAMATLGRSQSRYH